MREMMEIFSEMMMGRTLPAWPMWLLVTYMAVLVAMGIDLVAGVGKARRLGVATSSRALKMTCDKARKYFLPMACLTMVDAITAAWFELPALTMLMGIFNVVCEWKSVMESACDKQQIKRMQQGMEIMRLAKEDPQAAIEKILSDIDKNQEPVH